MMSRLSGQILAVAQQRREHFLGPLLGERVEPQLGVIGLTIPLMSVLGPVVHQQQEFRGSDGIGQQVQQLLGVLVDPVEVFEDQHQRLVETLTQDSALDRFQRPPLPDLPVHLRQRIVTLDDAEQTEQVRQRVFQTSIEDRDPAGNFLAPCSFIVLVRNPEIIAQQIDHRQINRCLPVRYRNRLQHHPAGLRSRLELEEQARLADPGLRHRRHDLPTPRLCLLGGMPQCFHLALASNELGQPAADRTLQLRAQRPESGHLVNVNRLADAFDPAGAERLELEVTFDEFLDTLSDHHRARRREGLQARRQAHRMPYGGVFTMCVAGLDGSDHHFSAVDSHPNRQWGLPPLAQPVRVTLEILLHPAGGM
jgi:hypothetical protein